MSEKEKGFWFGCLECQGYYVHESKMKKHDFGVIVCPDCGHHEFIMRKVE